MSTFGTTARASASSSFATSAHTLGEAQDAPVTITHFTDPMMGLSWECEPLLRKIETHFGSKVAVRNVMGLLVRNVIDFMTPEERSLPEVAGLIRYNARLAQIYRDEEPLAGTPINMEGFCLFAPNRRTSLPLCLAYEAVAAARPELAERFLYRLRYATVVECRPTTKVEELTRTAELCGMSADEFGVAYRSSDAQDRLYQDLGLKEQLRIFGLPAFVVSCNGRGALLHGVPTYQQLERAIAEVSNNSVRAHKPSASTEALLALFARHPLISLNELAAAFDLADAHAAIPLVQPRIDAGEIAFAPAPKGRFLCKKDAPQS